MKVDYSDMLGLPYIPERNDCLQTLRRYFSKLGIEIRDYAFPSDFWAHNVDLYKKFYANEGFVSIDTEGWVPQLHDVLLIQGSLAVDFATHAGVICDDNLVLHHFTDRRSEAVAFKGSWRRPALVLRHSSVKRNEKVNLPIDLTELMPHHVRRRLSGQTL